MDDTITLSGAWALYPMAVRWAEEFRKLYPEVKVDISAGGAGKGVADCLAGVVDIGMVSREVNPAETARGAWWVAVTKDAVVSTANEANPVLNDLLARGIRRDAFVDIWITGRIKTWGELAGGTCTRQVHVYTRSDACGAAETWAKYLGKKQEDLLGVGVYGDPGLVEAVRKDELGIGYNNIGYTYDGKTGRPLPGIRVIPIDLDGNGAIDESERFYGSRDRVVKAIAEGRYPSPPARELLFVCGGKPKREAVRKFIRWVLTDGQKFVPEAGYINLSGERLRQELSKLD